MSTHTYQGGWVTCGDCMNYLLKRSICIQFGCKHTHTYQGDDMWGLYEISLDENLYSVWC